MPWTDRLSLLSAMSFRPFAGLPEFLFDALWSAYWAAYRPGCRGRQRRNAAGHPNLRSEEHTSELQSLMRISYAVFCLKKKRIMNRLNMRENNDKHTKKVS